MNRKDIEKIFGRMQRMSASLQTKSGSGTGWSYTSPTGEKQNLRMTKMRGPDEIEDDFGNLALWVWSAKDYIKGFAQVQGYQPSMIEKFVNRSSELCLCADIANLLKHGSLRTSRSGKFPEIGEIRYRLPHTAMAKITFDGEVTEFDIRDPERVDITLPIKDQNGHDLGDGFELLRAGVEQWARLYSRLRRFPRRKPGS